MVFDWSFKQQSLSFIILPSLKFLITSFFAPNSASMFYYFCTYRPLFILVTWVSGFFLPVFIHIIFLYIFNFKAANFFVSHLFIVFLCISFIVLIKCYISDSCIINAKECPISVIEMNGSSQNGSYNFEKTYPGCLGRMVNLFELNIGVSPNKLLTDKPHRDGGHLFFCLFYSVLHCTYLKLEFSSM